MIALFIQIHLKFDLGLFKVHLCINAAIVDSYDVHLYVLFYTYCFRLGLVTVLQRAGVFNVYPIRGTDASIVQLQEFEIHLFTTKKRPSTFRQ
jgi:hypothetical protein